ncbi:methylated-DNA--[protein]-cysteine S-methyltransferase [Yimella sp. cx-51]|uniref:methylated-DNA--[protein]-cysteine S-methyltransferase n=1 Tax=Yimella sp. cx-51 TaxID=2770551 RepID=UPI00165EA1D8|nr:methylated-DNA--[protein]-cysteine S-methyltransferase [Yimella sp. cx-51]MBC9958233.1 methylated-DNA--[protein]-cysteine S-methyltransferase [Yimella sp. cx-51]QTH38736.1 methylated-DNA--[protein]-cysteine S-methyltransferase [Yimella sp. cx-51]
MRHTIHDGPLGPLTYVADDDAIVGIYFPGHWVKPAQDDFGVQVSPDDDEILALATAQLDDYAAGERQEFTVPVATNGDALSEQVWALLRQIPYGATTTYGELARQLGNPHLAQAVGRSVGHNPISIVIPCHRVIGSDGSLTGYAGGLDRKRFLLELEEPAEAKAARLF